MSPSSKNPAFRKFERRHQSADVEPDQLPARGIELLIGVDFYWKLITGRTKRLTEDLTAVHTK